MKLITSSVTTSSRLIRDTHIRNLLWAAMSPRLDIVGGDEKARAAFRRTDLLIVPDAANHLAEYPDRSMSDVRPSKPPVGQEDRASAKKPGNTNSIHPRDPRAVARQELRAILGDTVWGSEANFGNRLAILAELVDFSAIRDGRLPFAMGHPSPRQSCAKCARGTEGVIS